MGVLQPVKPFSKDIGAQEVIICDAVGEKESNDLHKFCIDIGRTLRIL